MQWEPHIGKGLQLELIAKGLDVILQSPCLLSWSALQNKSESVERNHLSWSDTHTFKTGLPIPIGWHIGLRSWFFDIDLNGSERLS